MAVRSVTVLPNSAARFEDRRCRFSTLEYRIRHKIVANRIGGRSLANRDTPQRTRLLIPDHHRVFQIPGTTRDSRHHGGLQAATVQKRICVGAVRAHRRTGATAVQQDRQTTTSHAASRKSDADSRKPSDPDSRKPICRYDRYPLGNQSHNNRCARDRRWRLAI